MTRRTTRVATWLALSVSASGQLGCRTPATQTDLTITTTCPERTDRDLTLFVTRADGVRDEYAFVDVTWDFERTLTPARADALSFSVEAVLRDDDVELDRTTILGEHVLGTRSARSLTLVDPACSSHDAGSDDASIDADVVADAGMDAWAPDAAPLPGCERRTYERAEDRLELLYSFAGGSGDIVPNSAAGAEAMTQLEAVPGGFVWSSDGTCAHVSGDPRPSTPSGRAIYDALTLCSSTRSISIEAWIDVETEPSGATREEVFTHGEQGTAGRMSFTLAVGDGEVVAATNGCDSHARPLNTFARPPGLVHLVLTQRPITLDASPAAPFDAGREAFTGPWGMEAAYVNGEEVALRGPVGDDRNEGCTPPGADPGLRQYGVNTGTESVGLYHPVHLGGDGDPWDGFRGCYHLLAVYCDGLTPTEVRDNYCAGPPRP